MAAAFCASAGDSGDIAFRRAQTRPLDGPRGQLGDRVQRGLQFVDHAGNQAAHGGQFLGAEELLLHAALIQQPQRDADLIAQVLRQRLLVGVEIAGPVVLIQFQDAGHLALGEHGDEEQRFGARVRGPPEIGKGLRPISGMASSVR